MTPDDDELVEKVRGLMAPAREGDSWLDRTLHSANTSAQLTEMRHEIARVILVQSAELARLRKALEPFADMATLLEKTDERTLLVPLYSLRLARAALETKG